MNMKKLLCLMLALVFALALAGCAESGSGEVSQAPETSDGGGGETKDDDIYIAAFSKGYQHVFWVRIQEGMQEACDEYGARMTYEAPDEGQNVDVQVEQIEAALGRNPDAILIASVDAKAIVPAIEAANAQGVPVFTFDSDSESKLIKAFYGTGNYAGGQLAAENMAKFIQGKGKVAIVANDQTSNSIVERRDGFMDYMEENHPDIEIVDIQYNDDDSFKSTEICTTFLLTHDDLAGIYGCGQSSSEGMVTAVNEQGMSGEVVCVGFDSGNLLLNAVKDGTLTGAVTQNPYNMGYICAKGALEYVVDGKEPAQYFNDSGSAFYTKDNIDSEEIQGMVYE
ncbi:MAG: ABC transporter substrate-binding protein [Christensenellales bacterium]|jgi:ribose transport system substrate-binding protein